MVNNVLNCGERLVEEDVEKFGGVRVAQFCIVQLWR